MKFINKYTKLKLPISQNILSFPKTQVAGARKQPFIVKRRKQKQQKELTTYANYKNLTLGEE